MVVDVVLPCLDEALALPWVLTRMPPGYRAIVVDNGSTDGSAHIARAHGALVLDAGNLDTVIARTEGVTASFLKELLRRSAIIAASESDSDRLVVSADQLERALDELLDTRNAMTRVLLGGVREVDR